MATIHKLTDAQCKSDKYLPDPGKKIRKLADGGSLYLWIHDDGRRYWRFRYVVQGKEGLLSLGTYPAVSLSEARVEAAKLRLQADPGAARKAAKQVETVAASNTFRSVAETWLAKQRHWETRYASDSRIRFERYIFPAIGSLPITGISKVDMAALIESIEAKGSSGLAYRLMPALSRVFRHAMARGLCEHNPLGDLDPRDLISKIERKKQPAVSIKDLPLLLRKIDAYDNRQIGLAIKLIFLIFTRANEALKGEWSEIDFNECLWRIPANRMKKRLPLLVPLSPQALEILKELKEIGCGSEFIFPGRTHEKPLGSSALLKAFKAMGYGGEQSTHGIRRIASTLINEACDNEGRPLFSGDAIEAQLAHLPESVRATYNEAQYLPQRRRMMQWWADFLDKEAKKGRLQELSATQLLD